MSKTMDGKTEKIAPNEIAKIIDALMIGIYQDKFVGN